MRYQAFLSYSHKADTQLAAALHAALHRFAKPWYKLRALHIFRDTTNLAANPSLWSTIEQALGESEYFVFFASEEAAQSFWVQRELDYWLTHRPLDHLLIVLTDGELVWDRTLADFDWSHTTALPKMLAGKLHDEPLYLDLRWARTAEQLSLRHPKFRDAVADLAAPLHGRPKDELIGEDIRQYRRTWRIAAAAVIALALFAATATVNGYLAVQQRNEARRQQQVAEEQRDQSRRRLVQLNVNNGVRLGDEGDLSGALLWYAEAAKLGQGRAAEEPLLRERISATVRAHPLLEHVWFNDRPVRGTGWLDDHHVGVLLDDGSARVWDVSTGQPAAAPLQRPDTAVMDVALVDGRIRALGAHADAATLWDVATGNDLAVLQHKGSINSASFSKDGKRVVTASEDRTARVWDATGRQLASLHHAEGVAYAALSIDASKVLTYTDDEAAVHVWNTTTAAHVTIALEAKPLEAELSPDGRSVVTLDENKRALLWSTTTGRRLSSLGDWEAVKLVKFSPDGKHVALPTWYGWVIVWDLDTDKEGKSIQLKGGGPVGVSFSDDSKRVVTSSSDLTVRVWNVEDGSPVTPPLWHDDFIHEALLSPDGTRLVTSGSEKGVVRVWKLTSRGSEQARFEHEGRSGDTGLNLATLNRDASRLLTASDFVALVWDPTAEAQSAAPLRIEPGTQVYHAAFSPDGGQVVTCTEDGVAKLWDVHTGQIVGALPHENRVEDAAFTPDGKLLATASGNQVCIWDTATQHQRRCMGDDAEPVTHVQFDRRGKQVLALYFGGALRVWDIETGQPQPALERHNAHFAIYSPDGNWIATAEGGITVHVLNAATGVAIEPATELANRLTDMVFSPDGTRLITADQSGTARVWAVASGAAITPPLSPGGVIMSAAFSPDGTQVVTAGKLVRVWDAATGAPLTPTLKPPGGVRRVEFSPDGHRIVGAGSDGSARVWDLSGLTGTIDDLVRLCHAYAVRRLDDAGALLPLSTDDFRHDWQALHP
jgi:WD40 repeat protein